MPRSGWTGWRGPAGWCVCFLMAGCLGPVRIEPDNVIMGVESTADTINTNSNSSTNGKPAAFVNSSVELLPEPQPQPQSNYHLLPLTRLQAPSDPFGLVGYQNKPNEPTKNNKPASSESPSAPPKKEAPLVAALRLTLEKSPRQARAILQQRYDKTDRDLLQALLSLTMKVGEGQLDKLPAAEVELALEQLRELTERLRQRAPLALGKVCFCREIVNFGQYTPLPADHEFQAGYDNLPGEMVKIYAEVRNFGAVFRNGQYETRLNSSLSIHKAGARKGELSSKVAEQNFKPEINCSLTPRQDYFITIQIHVFPRLPPGLYTLWIAVQDVTESASGQPAESRVATRSLDFKVCPPGTAQWGQP